MGAQEARQFKSFNDFWIVAIYCNYWFGYLNVRNVILMELISLFLPQNCKNHPAAEGSAPSVTRLSSVA